jgi:hypothetical protein
MAGIDPGARHTAAVPMRLAGANGAAHTAPLLPQLCERATKAHRANQNRKPPGDAVKTRKRQGGSQMVCQARCAGAVQYRKGH